MDDEQRFESIETFKNELVDFLDERRLKIDTKDMCNSLVLIAYAISRFHCSDNPADYLHELLEKVEKFDKQYMTQ